jgi:RNA polymerase sigma-70 factor (ECF subfamily)
VATERAQPNPWTAGSPLPVDARAVAESLDRPERFEAVFDAHHRAVWGYLARRAGRDVADDLAGEVFTIAFARRESFDGERGTVRPWLFGIAANLLRTRRRSSVRSERAVERLISGRGPELVGGDPALLAEDRQDVAALARALQRISDADREILLLFAWDELTYDEIATLLGIPIGTVRSRLARARQRLRELTGSIGQVTVESSHGRTVTDG